jgi:hypothetical protein
MLSFAIKSENTLFQKGKSEIVETAHITEMKALFGMHLDKI